MFLETQTQFNPVSNRSLLMKICAAEEFQIANLFFCCGLLCLHERKVLVRSGLHYKATSLELCRLCRAGYARSGSLLPASAPRHPSTCSSGGASDVEGDEAIRQAQPRAVPFVFFLFLAPFCVCVMSDGRVHIRECCIVGPACSAGPQPACRDGELPAHVSKDFVQLGRFPSDVALPGERELQE